jgi:hypothetical protein
VMRFASRHLVAPVAEPRKHSDSGVRHARTYPNPTKLTTTAPCN